MSCCSPVSAKATGRLSPTSQPVLEGGGLVDGDLGGAEVVERPRRHVDVDDLLQGGRIDPDHVLPGAVDVGRGPPEGGGGLDLGLGVPGRRRRPGPARPPRCAMESTTRSPAKLSSTVDSTDALVEAPRIEMNATRVTPIISAEAVAAVRFGFRMAFSRARLPATPRRRGRGLPSSQLTGRARTGPSTTVPTNTQQGAEADQRERRRRTRRRRWRPHAEEGEAGADHLAAAAAGRVVVGDVPHGGDGRHLRGPASGQHGRGHGDAEAGDHRHDDGVGGDDHVTGRDVDAHRARAGP